MIQEVAEIGKNGVSSLFLNRNHKQIMDFNPAKNCWRKVKKAYLKGAK
jgi:hypothetical protein